MFSAATGHQVHISLASVHPKDSIFHTNFESVILQEVGWSGLPRPVWATVPMERCGWG